MLSKSINSFQKKILTSDLKMLVTLISPKSIKQRNPIMEDNKIDVLHSV